MSEEKIKISPAKGRPMLRWVGKKPLDYIKGFPAQLIEVFDPLNTGHKVEVPIYDNLKDNWQNLLFHGDNKEVMATLIENGFRGKIDLVYIDPPFKSGADYVRKVQLRGIKQLEPFEIDETSILQQLMYEDIWSNDSYLQFMYERLLLMKELLCETGVICVHLDWHVGHYVKLVMDEVFNTSNFRNMIVWHYGGRGAKAISAQFPRNYDTILVYTKNPTTRIEKAYTTVKVPVSKAHKQGFKKDDKGRWFTTAPRGDYTDESIDQLEREDRVYKTRTGSIRIKYFLEEEDGFLLENKMVGDVWNDIPDMMHMPQEQRLDFKTQKPKPLLERIVGVSSKENSLVLDCFCGSGTTVAVAQELRRRWITCDINKGAIQMTSKRLQKIILDQIKKYKKAKPQEFPKYYSFGVYQVNNYDLQLLRTEAVELATQHIGIRRIRTDAFFDGTLGKSLVKIIDFNHPLTLLDLQLIQDELRKRPNEDRDITIVCLGKELAVDPQVEEWNKKHPVNKLRIIELKTDKKYGHFLVHKPAEAKVAIQRVSKNKAVIEIQDFISPTIIERLNIDSGLLKVKIPDFRCMIDTVLIDTTYDGKTFHIIYSDVPEKKDDLVKGKYEVELPNQKAKVAIKIIDMLGEEVLVELSPN
jgi:DNA modification methylase